MMKRSGVDTAVDQSNRDTSHMVPSDQANLILLTSEQSELQELAKKPPVRDLQDGNKEPK